MRNAVRRQPGHTVQRQEQRRHLGIARAEQLEVTAAPGLLRLQRREVDVLGRKSKNPGRLAGILAIQLVLQIKIGC